MAESKDAAMVLLRQALASMGQHDAAFTPAVFCGVLRSGRRHQPAR
jgi:hypothetical protein